MTFKQSVIAFATLLFPVVSQAETSVYGVLLKDLHTPFWRAVELGIKDTLQDSSIDYYSLTASTENTAQTQADSCLSMLQRKPNAIIISPVNVIKLQPCIKKANTANVAIISLENSSTGDISNTDFSGETPAYTDDKAAAEMIANYIADQLGADAKGHVLVINGTKNDSTASSRASGFSQQLAKRAPGLKIIGIKSDEGDTETHSAIIEFLAQPGAVQAIFATSDSLALDALDTVTASKHNNQIPVVGIDGSQQAIDSIIAGQLSATVSRLPYLIGKTSVENTTSFLNGESVMTNTVKPLLLTREVFNANTDPLLDYVRY